MKPKFFIIILLIFLLVGCKNVENNEKYNVEIEQSEDDEILVDDDLLYRIYETGVKVPKNSKLIIDELSLDIKKGETVNVYVVDIKNNISKELGDYKVGQYISCIIGSEGLYGLIGVVNNGDKIDLTPQVTIQTEVKEEPNIFLNYIK